MITKYKTFVFPRTPSRKLKDVHRKGVNVDKSYISVDVSGHAISQCFVCLSVYFSIYCSLSYLQYAEYLKTTYKWIKNNPVIMWAKDQNRCPIHILNIIGHYVHASQKWAGYNQIDSIKYWQWCGLTGALKHGCWECKLIELLADSVAVSQEVKCRVNTPPSNTTPKYICKRTEICSHKNVHMDVSSIIVQSSVKVKTVLMSTK